MSTMSTMSTLNLLCAFYVPDHAPTFKTFWISYAKFSGCNYAFICAIMRLQLSVLSIFCGTSGKCMVRYIAICFIFCCNPFPLILLTNVYYFNVTVLYRLMCIVLRGQTANIKEKSGLATRDCLM